jgi:hypothetical protein
MHGVGAIIYSNIENFRKLALCIPEGARVEEES